MVRAGLVTLNASDDPAANLPVTQGFVRDAARDGAQIVLTPEVTNCVSSSRSHQRSVLRREAEDPTLAALRETAAEERIWLLIGSLALQTDDPDGRFANRSFMIAPDGTIAARYDKIHMFDVDVSDRESYRESAGYRPGREAVTVETPLATFGMTICYDLRFPYLYRSLAKSGAEVLVVPSAFTAVTGEAHWHTLLRARAIETGCFVLAPAQTGHHQETPPGKRRTYGHSLAVSPWGEVLCDGGVAPGVALVDLDLAEVGKARKRIPSLDHDRAFEEPR
ncbi:carbon-nitrogen hydrolase family protein [Celeribacter indicus]|uniref:Nitrilase/cyanide hydratase and apolipoprotein N-acyltransferase n=1 Tax=Celeribacter indicus TaxID=1208324 RepID=A0A0B5DXI1_9RHOB|nr:carbon-nitrogen hydrolase family protein [Celeribacter indicus]AJE44967.1 Nitrilase/cyanide hydratase and apolipoprotein N-acyltransferase [Celeribacter indicus]SDW96008.1 Predicted amidohydrolase [Celeribacter indicus]